MRGTSSTRKRSSLPRGIQLRQAGASDAIELAALHTATAADLTSRYGRGHWSTLTTERGVLAGMRHSYVVIAVHEGRIIGTLRLTTKKPWAIDRTMITPVKRPLFLVGMAVTPELQRRGIGRLMLEHAVKIAKEWPADSIVLDAFDADAGAGDFYARCGYREIGRKEYKGDPLRYYELLL